MKSEKMHGYLCWKMKDAALIFLGTLMLFYGVHFMSTVKEGFRQRIFPARITAMSLSETFMGVPVLFQNPELPTGCEITSLTMVLNYLGYSVDKCHLSDTYLSKGEIGRTDFRQSFVGNPRDETSYGCYASVIAECANRYLKEQESVYRAYDISGVSLDELLRETDAGHPVIIWGTINMLEPYDTMVWEVDGKQIQWRANEHCMVLIGQDAKNIYVNDPLYRKVSYDYNIFKDRYEKMFSQAVVIKSGRAVVG